ncbi:MAG: cation:proton antiporter subunit C [Lachnospiraceae bacterium]|nr:cation:proton antiporter subunit C [Lachnospiraceae bacterium]
MIGPNLFYNVFSVAAVILFSVGFTTLMLHRNMIKKIIGFNIMDTAVYLFLASKGYIYGRKAPIIVNDVKSTEAYINPIPAGLVLTGIVVSVSVTALMLAITIRLYERYHSLDIDEISLKARMDAPGRNKYRKKEPNRSDNKEMAAGKGDAKGKDAANKGRDTVNMEGRK